MVKQKPNQTARGCTAVSLLYIYVYIIYIYTHTLLKFVIIIIVINNVLTLKNSKTFSDNRIPTAASVYNVPTILIICNRYNIFIRCGFCTYI